MYLLFKIAILDLTFIASICIFFLKNSGLPFKSVRGSQNLDFSSVFRVSCQLRMKQDSRVLVLSWYCEEKNVLCSETDLGF